VEWVYIVRREFDLISGIGEAVEIPFNRKVYLPLEII